MTFGTGLGSDLWGLCCICYAHVGGMNILAGCVMQTSATMAQLRAVLVQVRALVTQLAAQICQLMLPATWEVLINTLLALNYQLQLDGRSD